MTVEELILMVDDVKEYVCKLEEAYNSLTDLPNELSIESRVSLQNKIVESAWNLRELEEDLGEIQKSIDADRRSRYYD